MRAVGLRTGCNPYVQVALTYIRRLFWSGPGGFIALVVFGWLSIAGIVSKNLEPIAAMALPLAIVLFVCGPIHIWEQFADSRAHVLPNFRRVHAIVAVVMTAVLTVLLPATATWLLGSRSVGLVSIVLLLFGGALWFMSHAGDWGIWLLPVVGIGAAVAVSGHRFEQLIWGELEPLAVLLLVIGAVMVVLGEVRVFRLNEDTPAYHFRWTGRNRMSGQHSGGRDILLPGTEGLTERYMSRLIRHARLASASWWSRACRWQVGFLPGWAIALCGLGCSVFVLLFAFDFSRGERMPVDPTSVIFTNIAVAVTMAWLPQRLRTISYDLRLPVSRASYLKQFAAAVALTHLRLWAAFLAAWGFCWLLSGWEPSQCGRVATILLISACGQIYFFGFLAWLGQRSRSSVLVRLVSVLLFYISCAGFFVLFLIATVNRFVFGFLTGLTLSEESASSIQCLLLLCDCVLMMVAGLVFLRQAYRRWLLADID